MLAQMTLRLLQKRTFEDAIHVILEDVIALHGAEFGNVQLPLGDELFIAAQYGLPKPFLKAFKRVRKDDGSACGRALRLGVPVVVADVCRARDQGRANEREIVQQQVGRSALRGEAPLARRPDLAVSAAVKER